MLLESRQVCKIPPGEQVGFRSSEGNASEAKALADM